MVDIPHQGQKWEKVELPPTPPMPERRSSKHLPSHLSPFVHDPAIVQWRREGGRRPFPCVGYWPPVRPPPPLCATESQTEERLSYILYSSFVLFPFPFLFHSFSFHPGRRRRRQLSSGLSIVASDAVTVEHKEDAPLPPPRSEASFPSLSTTTHAAAPPPPPPLPPFSTCSLAVSPENSSFHAFLVRRDSEWEGGEERKSSFAASFCSFQCPPRNTRLFMLVTLQQFVGASLTNNNLALPQFWADKMSLLSLFQLSTAPRGR